MELKVRRLDPRAKLPTRAHHDDAGMDLYALDNVNIASGEVSSIPLGIAMEIPPGYVGLIWDKSSQGYLGNKVFGGVIDAQYRGEIAVMIGNLAGNKVKAFSKGQKVAQMIIQRVELPSVVEVDELSDTARAEGGYGSSGAF